jgi:hypothetical protein
VSVLPGDTYVFDPNGTNQNHLWVVLATYVPDFELELWAIVGHITTLTPRTQLEHRICVLTAEDEDSHPFVHHPSYVLYSALRAIECSRLPADKAHDPVCSELLVRICRGAHTSKLTKRGLKLLIPRDG